MKCMDKHPYSQGMDSSDEIAQELPLYLNTALTPYLHTISGIPAHPEHSSMNHKVRMKRQQGWLWVEMPTDCRHPTFDHLKAATFQPAESSESDVTFSFKQSRGYVGMREQCSDQFILVKRGDTVCLTPVKGAISLHPSLAPLDALDATKLAESKALRRPSEDIKNSSNPSSSSKLVLPVIQKRETEEQLAARLTSYAHLHKLWLDDAWHQMAHYPAASAESSSVAFKLLIDPDNIDGELAFYRPSHFLQSFLQ